jgi:hypothetical protein
VAGFGKKVAVFAGGEGASAVLWNSLCHGGRHYTCQQKSAQKQGWLEADRQHGRLSIRGTKKGFLLGASAVSPAHGGKGNPLQKRRLE